MFGEAHLKNINEEWKKRSLTLTKQDVNYVLGRTNFRNLLQGFLTAAYYKRSKVVKQGEVIYGYAFQDWTKDIYKIKEDYPVWVLYSPSKLVNNDPSIFKKCVQNIRELKDKQELNKEEKRFLDLIQKPLSNATQVELPPSLNEGNLIYLSIVYRRLCNTPSFHLGLNLYLYAPTISKEILFLPLKYCDEEYKNNYEPNGYPL